MTFLRVIKWISFVVFILAIALTGVAQGFIFNEMGLFSKDADRYKMSEVITAVSAKDDLISSLFNKKEETAAPSEDAVPTPVADTTAANATITEATPIEPAEETAPAASAYSCDDVNKVIVTVMKYGSYKFEMEWLNKLSANKLLGAQHVEINLAFFVAYIALFVAFILHIITKRSKSFYGYLLMIFGYILFAALIPVGYYIGAVWGILGFSLESNDLLFVRTLIIFGTFLLSAFIALPYYRLGVRQIANKTYKKRIESYKKKLQRRGA